MPQPPPYPPYPLSPRFGVLFVVLWFDCGVGRGRRVIGRQVWVEYVRLLGLGVSRAEAARRVGVSVPTVVRHQKDPGSVLFGLLGGVGGGGVVGLGDVGGLAGRALVDFGFFRERYLGRGRVAWQEEVAERVVGWLGSPGRTFVVVNAPPGSGKSTFFTHDLLCWLIVKDRRLRCMVGSRSEHQARLYSGRLRRTFERVVPVRGDSWGVERGLACDAVATLVGDFGRFRPLGGELWRLEEFVVAQEGGVGVEDKESTVVAYGMDSGFLGGRFDLVVWDDLVDLRSLRSVDAREGLLRWWETEAETRLEPGGLLILQGQRLGRDDLYRWALDQLDGDVDVVGGGGRKYEHVVFKAHYEDRCTGVHEGEGVAYPGGCLLDPHRLPWRELNRLRVHREERYRVLYQQEDYDPGSGLVPLVCIDGGRGEGGVEFPGCWDEGRGVGEVPRNVGGVVSVVTADPSPTRSWAVQWWLYQPGSQLQWLMDLFRGPMDAPDFLDWNNQDGVFSGLLEEWWGTSVERGVPFSHVIVESNAAQRFLLQYDHVRRWQALRGVNVVPHATHRNKSDPKFGVQTLAPHYEFGRVRLPGRVLDGSRRTSMKLVDELVDWPNGRSDDCVMAHWFLLWNAPNLFPEVGDTVPRFERPSWVTGSRWAG